MLFGEELFAVFLTWREGALTQRRGIRGGGRMRRTFAMVVNCTMRLWGLGAVSEGERKKTRFSQWDVLRHEASAEQLPFDEIHVYFKKTTLKRSQQSKQSIKLSHYDWQVYG